MAKVKEYLDGDVRIRWCFMCQGCGHMHYLPTPDAHVPGDTLIWGFNGDVDKPTFSPSLMLKTGKYADPNFDDEGAPELSTVCHSIVTDGMIHFCGDSTHHLSGQTLELPEIE